MTELLLTFPAEIRKDIAAYLEKQKFDILKASKSRVNRLMSNMYKKAFGADIFVSYEYKFLSNTQAQLSFSSNVSISPDLLCQGVQKRFLKDIVKVEVIK